MPQVHIAQSGVAQSCKVTLSTTKRGCVDLVCYLGNVLASAEKQVYGITAKDWRNGGQFRPVSD